MPDNTHNTAPRELIMYSRRTGCPSVTLAKHVLDDYALSYREIFIDVDAEARERVLDWTGFLSVPTLVIAEPGSVLPCGALLPLERGFSPRGIDRGPMITEPNAEQLTLWLVKHGLIAVDAPA